MRILVLVIASYGKPEYWHMEQIWKSRVVPDWCDMWLVHSKPACQWIGDLVNDSWLDPENVEVDIREKILFVKQDECLIPGILAKTVKALEFFKNSAYDYVWRTNLSSVLDFQGLYNYCYSIKVPDFYGGYIGIYNGSIRFASGAGFLMSANVLQWLVSNQHLLRWDLIDDVAIGAMLEPQFGLVHIDRQWIQSADEHVNKYVFHYRCESYMHLNTVSYMQHVIRNLPH
jgi:hypothetical protein